MEIEPSQPVRVFKNWKHGCYAIMQRGVLRASAKQVRLANVEFLVRESGRQRMIREGRRNIHAYAVGYLLDHVHPAEPRELAAMVGRAVLYNPYEFASFVDEDTHIPVLKAALVQLDEHGMRYVAHPADGVAAAA